MKRWIGWIGLCVVSLAGADEVRLRGGTVLMGQVLSISETQVEIKTDFAGTLTIDRSKIDALSTDEPLFVRLDSGEVSSTPVDPVSLPSIVHAWENPDQDPKLIALADAEPKWAYRAAARVSGKSGNTEEKTFGANLSATRTGDENELNFYLLYDSKESADQKTSDETKIGGRYTSYFSEAWGWYVRQEFEKDEFENISLRSVSAFGLNYRFLDDENSQLSTSGGLSYRYETYEDNTAAQGIVGLDFGLKHFYRLPNRFEIHNELTYLPSLEDMASYLFIQDSAIDFPLGDSLVWKMRCGLRNDYNSQPEGNRENLDTTYYSGLVLDWE